MTTATKTVKKTDAPDSMTIPQYRHQPDKTGKTDGKIVVNADLPPVSVFIKAGASTAARDVIAQTIEQSQKNAVRTRQIMGDQLAACVVFARMFLKKGEDAGRVMYADNGKATHRLYLVLPQLTKPNGGKLGADETWKILAGLYAPDKSATTRAKSAGLYLLECPGAAEMGSIEAIYNLAKDVKKAGESGEDSQTVKSAQMVAIASGLLEDASSGAEALRMIREHVGESSAAVKTIQNRSDAKTQAKKERAELGRLLAKGDPAAMAEGVLGVIIGKDSRAFTLALARMASDREDEAVQSWALSLVEAMRDIVAE